MKVKNVFLAVAALLLLVSVSRPSEARVNVGVSVGLPAFSFSVAPEVAVIPGTYVYYAPDVDVDILFYGGRWYRPWGGRWYRARDYNGPWVVVAPRFVPVPLLHLPGDYRRAEVYERIPYNNFHRHWRSWERDRYWERDHDWWGRGREMHHARRDMRHDRRDRREDRREMDHDRRDRY